MTSDHDDPQHTTDDRLTLQARIKSTSTADHDLRAMPWLPLSALPSSRIEQVNRKSKSHGIAKSHKTHLRSRSCVLRQGGRTQQPRGVAPVAVAHAVAHNRNAYGSQPQAVAVATKTLLQPKATARPGTHAHAHTKRMRPIRLRFACAEKPHANRMREPLPPPQPECARRVMRAALSACGSVVKVDR